MDARDIILAHLKRAQDQLSVALSRAVSERERMRVVLDDGSLHANVVGHAARALADACSALDEAEKKLNEAKQLAMLAGLET